MFSIHGFWGLEGLLICPFTPGSPRGSAPEDHVASGLEPSIHRRQATISSPTEPGGKHQECWAVASGRDAACGSPIPRPRAAGWAHRGPDRAAALPSHPQGREPEAGGTQTHVLPRKGQFLAGPSQQLLPPPRGHGGGGEAEPRISTPPAPVLELQPSSLSEHLQHGDAHLGLRGDQNAQPKRAIHSAQLVLRFVILICQQLSACPSHPLPTAHTHALPRTAASLRALKSPGRNPAPSVTAETCKEGPFRRCLGHEGGALLSEMNALREESPGSSLHPPPCGDTKAPSVHAKRTVTRPCWRPDLRLSASTLRERHLFVPPSLGYFVRQPRWTDTQARVCTHMPSHPPTSQKLLPGMKD